MRARRLLNYTESQPKAGKEVCPKPCKTKSRGRLAAYQAKEQPPGKTTHKNNGIHARFGGRKKAPAPRGPKNKTGYWHLQWQGDYHFLILHLLRARGKKYPVSDTEKASCTDAFPLEQQDIITHILKQVEITFNPSFDCSKEYT